jgi:replicative DNA helicase
MVQIQLINKILRTKNLDIAIENDLTPDYFVPFSAEFEFIQEHYRQYGNVPDIETFLSKFREFDLVEVTESDDYLIDQINEEYQYRNLVPILQKAAELTKGNATEALDYLRTATESIGVGIGNIGVDIISQARVRYDEYKKKRDSDKPWMMPTGFEELDKEIGGLSPGEEFVVIVARTNNGKSWVLCKIAEHNWKKGYNIGYISPEMSASAIGYRFDTLNAHFSNFGLYTGKDVEGYEEHIEDLEKNPRGKFIVATPLDFNKRITVSKLRSFCLKNKIDLLCIDGITYLTDERYKRGDNKTISLTNISEDIMSLSCELKIPIIAVVQANRNGVDEDGGVPSLESIRDSDGIAHNASKVLSIRQQNNKLKIEVTKARNCRVGIKLVYDWQIDIGKFSFSANDDDTQVSDRNRGDFPTRQGRRQQKEPELEQPIRAKTTSPLPF